MVDANGKKHKFNRVNNMAEKDDAPTRQYEDTNVGAIANLSPYHHLNWQATLTQLQLRVAHRPLLLMQLNICLLNC